MGAIEKFAAQTMTSLEIAELVNARHDNVKRTIERLAGNMTIQLPPLVEAEKINGLGLKQKATHYIFSGERLVSGFRV